MSPVNLAKARILVTNDDGIHAPGLEALIEIATQLSTDVWVVAPEVNQSGAGHSLSLSRPIRSRQVSEAKFAVEGTPTDCVLFAVKHLLKDRKPDIVLSGVNRGTNMADDVTYSGTIAAAMEGCLLGLPVDRLQPGLHPRSSGEVGHRHASRRRRGAPRAGRRHGRATCWSTSTSPTWSRARSRACRSRTRARAASAATSSSAHDPRGGTYYWIGYQPQESEIDEASDIAAVRSGHISVTPLHLDLTHEAMRRKLRAEFEAARFEAD